MSTIDELVDFGVWKVHGSEEHHRKNGRRRKPSDDRRRRRFCVRSAAGSPFHPTLGSDHDATRFGSLEFIWLHLFAVS
jgi:hypothetical protein